MDNKEHKFLKKALKYYNKYEFNKAISLLERHVFKYRNFFFYYYLLGLCYLRTGNLSSAKPFLTKAYKIKPDDLNIQQAIAILFVAQGKEDKAIQIWLKMLERAENTDLAQKSLDTVRKYEIEKIIFWKNNKKFNYIFPKVKYDYVLISYKKIIFSSLLLIISLLFIVSKFNFKNIVAGRESTLGNTEIINYIDAIKIDNKEKLENQYGQFLYILREEEIKEAFENIKKYLKNNSHNQAKIEINKILNSNASNSIKVKAKNLANFIESPNLLNFKEYIKFDNIQKNPKLYEGVYVKWSGIVNNVEEKDNIVSFDFYIGYEKGKLEGIITSRAIFNVNLSYKDTVEILGKIELVEEKPILEVITIHKIS